jgi:hypothetical protein
MKITPYNHHLRLLLSPASLVLNRKTNSGTSWSLRSYPINYREATIKIARTELICRADGHNFVLNEDEGAVRGGLYRRFPWFGTDVHDPIPLDYSDNHEIVVLHVGNRPDRVWHFWAASSRRAIPQGHLEGCTVKIRAKVSNGALLQIGFDYWRDPTVAYGSGGNNHEAGASDWYFPAPEWQEATFSDIKR